MKTLLVPCLSDNYAVIIHDPKTLATACIDAPEAAPIQKALSENGWKLTDILITHHHHDHVGGVKELKAQYGCRVVAPHDQAAPIHNVDIRVSEGDTITVGNFKIRILETPGHTLDHVCYVFDAEKLLFAGDTLFAGGCGRVFEGTYDMMWESLQKLRGLPDDYQFYSGHEYTVSNLKFCQGIDEDNEQLKVRTKEAVALREIGQPTIPTKLGLEKKTNIFLRADDPVIANALGMVEVEAKAIFSELRERKNRA